MMRKHQHGWSDGWETLHFCDGKQHICKTLDDFGHTGESRNDVAVEGDCDGSCRKEADLRVELQKLRGGKSLVEGDRIVEDPVELDAGSAEMFARDGAISGRRFDTSYGKRSSSSDSFCTGTHHVEVHTSFDWAHDPTKGCSHKVTTTTCDGSCKMDVTPDDEGALRIGIERYLAE
ncbi:MAG: hypothetical protein WCJ29_02175 [bacterium]